VRSEVKLDNRVALVTGAGSGIGRAIAFTFANEGAKVVVNDMNVRGGNETVELIRGVGKQAMFSEADVSRHDDVKNMMDKALKQYGRLDVLCNNAGIYWEKAFTDMTENDWDRMIDTNLKGAFLCSKYAVAQMLKQGGGAIVNIGSELGIFGAPGASAYCASKGGLTLVTKALAREYGPSGIRVNCLSPRSIATPILTGYIANSKNPEGLRKILIEAIPLRRFGQPEDVAKAALFLASDDSSFINGAVILIDGGARA
jgi:NAD(P)-dependent dehydrogenase (short-subunit alcohol dehydrogenase family)